MSRSRWKGYFIDLAIIKKKFKINEKTKKEEKIIIWSRRSTISKKYINKFVWIHNGKDFKKLFISPDKIGFKFGQFIFTKKNAFNFKDKNPQDKSLKKKDK